VEFVVETTGVANCVAGGIAAPKRRCGGVAVLAGYKKIARGGCCLIWSGSGNVVENCERRAGGGKSARCVIVRGRKQLCL